MLNIYVIILTGIFFAMCTAVMVFTAVSSVQFRKKIAVPHGFAEGILTGAAFPALLATYGFLFVEFISFIVFKTHNETFLTVRLTVYALTVLAFTVLKTFTPPLLALWFGKTAFWDNRGEHGKNLFSDIYCAKVHKQKNVSVINSQQLYKITFYVKGKTAFLFPKRYSCKMTAKQISALTDHVDFKSRDQKPEITRRSLVYAICLPILIFGIVLTTFMMAVSTGVLNEEKYQSSKAPLSDEISTVTEITDVRTDGEKLYVFYENITSVNVYDADGKFIYAISLTPSVFEHSEIGIASNGMLLYHRGNEIIYYDNGAVHDTVAYGDQYRGNFEKKPLKIGDSVYTFDEHDVFRTDADGKKVTVIDRPDYLVLFAPEVIWPIALILVVALFILRYFTVTKEKLTKKQ